MLFSGLFYAIFGLRRSRLWIMHLLKHENQLWGGCWFWSCLAISGQWQWWHNGRLQEWQKLNRFIGNHATYNNWSGFSSVSSSSMCSVSTPLTSSIQIKQMFKQVLESRSELKRRERSWSRWRGHVAETHAGFSNLTSTIILASLVQRECNPSNQQVKSKVREPPIWLAQDN